MVVDYEGLRGILDRLPTGILFVTREGEVPLHNAKAAGTRSAWTRWTSWSTACPRCPRRPGSPPPGNPCAAKSTAK